MHTLPVQSLTLTTTKSLTKAVQPAAKRIEKQVTDEFVISSLKEELAANMNKSEIEKWVGIVLDICKQLKIEPKHLPINKDLPGNLTKEESHKFANMVFQKIG